MIRYLNNPFNKERDLFEALKKNLVPDLEKAQDQFSKYDCYSNEHKIYIELKCRKSHYNELVIEKIKYEGLLNKSKVSGVDPVYINSTPFGVWAFRLNDLEEPSWTTKDMPRETDFKRTHMITKQVGYYDIKSGVNITEYFE
jgi:hypothetical protein